MCWPGSTNLSCAGLSPLWFGTLGTDLHPGLHYEYHQYHSLDGTATQRTGSVTIDYRHAGHCNYIMAAFVLKLLLVCKPTKIAARKTQNMMK